jgi:hypothetical protein
MRVSSQSAVPESAARRRARFELVFASIWLAIGLFVLPGMIYAVGVMMLGPYGEGAGLGTFYADFFRDLVLPAGRAWILALGPLLLISVLRLLFLDVKAPKSDAKEPERPHSREHARVEPRVSME